MSNVVRRPFNYRRLFWKWHLYAGLLGAPMLILIAVTGAILVFSPEIDRLLRPDLWVIEAPAEASTAQPNITDQVMIDSIRARYPKSKFINYQQNAQANEPCQMLMITPGISGIHDVWINPYTGEFVGERARETAFVRIVEQLHRRLLADEIGSSIVELFTGWAIVLCGTGLYMWWPKTVRQLRTALTWSNSGGAYRVNWRLHNAIGGWSAVFLLLLALTGMVFSTYTGGMFYQAMKASGETRKNPVAEPPKSRVVENAKPVSVDGLIAYARQRSASPGKFVVQFPRDKAGSFVLYPVRSSRPSWEEISSFRVWGFDQYSGELLAESDWNQFGPLFQFRFLSLVIHFGSIFGLGTKILVTLACLAVPLLAGTGFLIWWWKRDRKQPDLSRGRVLQDEEPVNVQPYPSWWTIAAGIMLCVMFPTIGVSVIVLATYELLTHWFRGSRSRSESTAPSPVQISS